MSDSTIQTGNATFTRKGKTKTIRVRIEDSGHGTRYVLKANGKPFFGTTGYLGAGRHDDGSDTLGTVYSYRREILATDFVFTPDAE